MQKLNLKNYAIKKEKKSTTYEWQDYLLTVFKEFGITKQYQSRYWKKAKANISFFRGCVENLKEGKTEKQLKTMGQLLSWKLYTEPKLKKLNIKEQ